MSNQPNPAPSKRRKGYYLTWICGSCRKVQRRDSPHRVLGYARYYAPCRRCRHIGPHEIIDQRPRWIPRT